MKIARGVLLAMVVVALLAEPAAAHNTVRDGGYNRLNSWTAGGVCNYQHQHGNYGGAYVQGMFQNAACNYIYMTVTGCTGLNCPTLQVYEFDEDVLNGTSIPGKNIIYSHMDINYTAGQITSTAQYHLSVPGI